jgi:hypothetical protein
MCRDAMGDILIIGTRSEFCVIAANYLHRSRHDFTHSISDSIVASLPLDRYFAQSGLDSASSSFVSRHT